MLNTVPHSDRMYILDQEYSIQGVFSNVFKYTQDCAVHSGVYLTCILPVYCQRIHVVYVFNVYIQDYIKVYLEVYSNYMQAPVGKCGVSNAKVTVFTSLFKYIYKNAC